MASQHPAQTEAETTPQQGDTVAMPQQTGTTSAPHHEQQEQAMTPIFRDFASI